MKAREKKLIKKVKAGDSQALEELFSLYKPLVGAVVKNYYVSHYEWKDWQQDAMIICYETALVFNSKKGDFCSFYRTKLFNHARTLVRYTMATRRKINHEAVSWEMVREHGQISEPMQSPLAIPVDETYNTFVKNLSRLELISLQTILGEISMEYAIDHLGIEAIKLVRARSRTLRKMRKVLF
ncbi:DNA-directed RNA polymerase subunit sigma [Lactobacillus kefiranofaciens]|uniref:RNA polymerase sporulation-specific sigma factor n=1 Tax=Lactobacillus kefiranofaciens TaxID=267818 RepID=A0AAX3UGU7_9LACO|nr:DNA-directed RNA polymerase subunit sigma [Lactobacillus kefiranofaciens]AEG39746.1 DNA-directed RNA polymerase sigma factor, sigma H [Lactobacillus kefiranofaciens subsp. kefiranofaciens]KRL30320.1 DNA-directed RNA polymerase sigma factor, sigma H [Lactobacillus kefiranofaciens subsp. kefirgranum DSM 10550 = JCM 8572]KRM22917.1 DNA-directed RNA polymerase sigma factor, sigma H [Lactobacillus kefiranofaciens subsp. kefiranofaciens DSM 5016 = JCM 6985]MCJ2171587.1 sigma-70 family RNA polymera